MTSSPSGSPSPEYSPSISSSPGTNPSVFGRIGSFFDRHLLLTMLGIFVLLWSFGLGYTEWRNTQRAHEVCESRQEAREATRQFGVQLALAVPQQSIRSDILEVARDLPPINCP